MESRVDDVQSLCNKRRGSLQRRINPTHRPVQAVQPKPSSSASPDITPKTTDSRHQLAADEDRRKWRPSLKARVCTPPRSTARPSVAQPVVRLLYLYQPIRSHCPINHR